MATWKRASFMSVGSGAALRIGPAYAMRTGNFDTRWYALTVGSDIVLFCFVYDVFLVL